ncbi:MAG: hypothetical protein IT514_04210 [Burkholderiales bacterium]|nr:hypothetical protein [Burkholderiales bacterium]
MEEAVWNVLDPSARPEIERLAGAARLGDFAGRRVGLWWNGKPGGDVFLDELAGQVLSRVPGMSAVRMWELEPATTTFYGVSPPHLARMAREADLVIGALGD